MRSIWSISIASKLSKIGLFEKDVRALVAAAGLSVYRPNTHEVTQFHKPGWLWMALVLLKFTSPDRKESYVERHYVLIVDYLISGHGCPRCR
ncbi:hypothetical protein [Hyalangium sp.]|uniref:hypothetical protein n=1 Tax=Hyalangium sp. TaxID=2028555 RepID=UPI002D592317|nr:hypothetical protein [Hyalangium sp.]HYH99411.1 hypothetical protein [Hyalangium sp.]